ncbi:hypothetical protein [Streptomyces sp. NPDC001401]|uniref:hypothetical protein n=1 Tax=Streptomyces sp. NPDC001401 TaxID=3364570 RepID=UPI003693FA21
MAATEAVASADSAQRQAVDDAVHQAFGDHYAIGNIRFSSSPDGDSGTVMASLPVGFVQVNWPERNEITASLDMSDSGKPSGFPVPGAPAHVTSSEQATQVATKYAQKHFPWGVPQTRVKASAVGDNASLGWLVSWRRYHNDVLMPMRLDVQIDRSGHVSQLSTRQAPDVAVPPVRVNNKKTAELAMNAVPGCRKVDVGDLFAMRTESKWQAVWRVVVTCKDSTTLMNINATSGAIETKEKNSSRG